MADTLDELSKLAERDPLLVIELYNYAALVTDIYDPNRDPVSSFTPSSAMGDQAIGDIPAISGDQLAHLSGHDDSPWVYSSCRLNPDPFCWCVALYRES
jgi:hypothetical protein